MVTTLRTTLAAALALATPLALTHQATAAPKGPHYGGTLRLVSASAEGTIDPQVNYTVKYWQVFAVTYDGLVTFQKAGGKAAFNIVPDLATSVPKPTDGGKTYTFKLRQGIDFSNGKPLTVEDVKYTMTRLFKVLSPNAGTWYNDIKGAQACIKTPKTCTLPGVVADPKTHTVTFHLTQPDPEFLDQLAVPFAAIVPKGTPEKDMGTTPIPGTGAYMIKSYDPNKEMVLVRNPHFKQWSAKAQPWGYPAKITYRFGLTPSSQVTGIENGQYDWMFDNIPSDRLNEIATRYKKQVHLDPLLSYWYINLNTHLKPFDNIDARRAVDYAINRADLVKLYGGRALARPSCQVLPPGMPGYEPYCPFTKGASIKHPAKKWTAPDMAKARALMQKSGMIGQKVTIITQTVDPYRAIGVYLQSVLNKLGFKASVKMISPNIEFTYLQNTNNKAQIGVTDWYQDYPAPSDFLKVLYSCANYHPGSDTSINMSGFCDKSIDQEMHKAGMISLTDKKKANALWAKIDRQVTNSAATVTMFNPRKLDFVSRRLRNFTFSGQNEFLFDLAQVK